MRILEAAQEMLLGMSLADVSMDELARAAGVSRGTLYRLFPGKPALLRGLVAEYSPFEAMLAILARHPDDPPSVVLPRIARAVTGIAERRLGLMRAVFHETTSGSPASLAGVRPVLGPALGALAAYLRDRCRPADCGGWIRSLPCRPSSARSISTS
jgi:AcrR family transcriptional regulator